MGTNAALWRGVAHATVRRSAIFERSYFLRRLFAPSLDEELATAIIAEIEAEQHSRESTEKTKPASGMRKGRAAVEPKP
jgi:hypothetical protein